jgi:transposase-like protein
MSLLLYDGLTLAQVVAYTALKSGIDVHAPKIVVTPESRRILWKICPLFALDSLGGGFVTSALLAYFFYQRFGVVEGALGILFFFARAANAVSHAGAAWLARRIGLVNTMVFTHIPASLLLMTVPFAPSFWVAALLFLLREGLVEMDVPTRQSYVMAVVRPEERTFASGITHLVRVGAWAVAPSFAGLFMKGVLQAAPLFVGAGLKIVYDILLYAAFRLKRIPDASARSLHAFVKEAIEPGSTAITDGWEAYEGLNDLGYEHKPRNISASGKAASTLLPRVHRAASLLKRWLLDTHQGRVDRKQLPYYLDEFTFRLNRRTSRARGLLFYRLARQAVASARPLLQAGRGDALPTRGCGHWS